LYFQKKLQCNSLENDTAKEICNNLLDAEYKVLLYVDSAGCTDCRLKLFQWKQLMAESESLFADRLKFLFFFQPKNEREIHFILRKDAFDHPVWIDRVGAIQALNHFPNKPEFQCFLLNADNEVIMIGNPALNPKIWALYKEQISGEKQTQLPITSIEADKTTHDYGSIQRGGKYPVSFSIKNTGAHPLLIHRVSASCGCTSVDWDRQPIEPGQSAEVKAVLTPEESGYFNKTIEVYGNFEPVPLQLTITATTTQ
jgi:hypothetical protein